MFVSFGYLSNKMIIPLLIPILYSIRHYLLEEFEEKLREPNNKNTKKPSVFLKTFIVSISYSLNSILFIIEYNKTKTSKKKKKQKEFDNQLLIEKLKNEKKKRKCRLLLLFLLPLLNYLILLFYDILSIFKPKEYYKYYFYPLSIPFFFIITALLSFLLLNYKIYCHQTLAMIISPILSLSLLIILVINRNGFNNFNNILDENNLYLVESLGLRSLRYVLAVLGKLFMEKMFVSYHKLMTFLGIFGIIFSLIANSLSYLIYLNYNHEIEDYFETQDNNKMRIISIFKKWGNFDTFNFFIFIGIIILWFIEKYVAWFCIYTFSPNHYTMHASVCKY